MKESTPWPLWGSPRLSEPWFPRPSKNLPGHHMIAVHITAKNSLDTKIWTCIQGLRCHSFYAKHFRRWKMHSKVETNRPTHQALSYLEQKQTRREKRTYVDLEGRRNSKLCSIFGILGALSVRIRLHWRYIWILPSTECCFTWAMEMNSHLP